jgi:hypothetical protein
VAWTFSDLQKHESPHKAGFFVWAGWSGLLDAEGVTASQAAAVVEDDAVQLAADGGASGAAGYAADESTEDRAGKTAECNADGAADNAKRGTGFRTSRGGSDATGSSGDGANSATGLAALMSDFDARGIAARTNLIHGVLLIGCAGAAREAEWHRPKLRLHETSGDIRRVVCISNILGSLRQGRKTLTKVLLMAAN